MLIPLLHEKLAAVAVGEHDGNFKTVIEQSFNFGAAVFCSVCKQSSEGVPGGCFPRCPVVAYSNSRTCFTCKVSEHSPCTS